MSLAKGAPRDFSADRKSTRLNSSHTVIYTLSLHDALPISRLKPPEVPMLPFVVLPRPTQESNVIGKGSTAGFLGRSEEHTSELQSHSDLHSFPTRRSSDLPIETTRGAHAALCGPAAADPGEQCHWQREHRGISR